MESNLLTHRLSKTPHQSLILILVDQSIQSHLVLTLFALRFHAAQLLALLFTLGTVMNGRLRSEVFDWRLLLGKLPHRKQPIATVLLILL